MEIERKFLIKQLPDHILNTYIKKKHIIQDYLYMDNYTIVRKRKIIENNLEHYTYTIKTFKVGISVNEFEKEISKSEYEKLSLNPAYNTLEKDRYIIPIENNLKIELDVFQRMYTGLIYAEIEFPDEQSAKKFEIPNWFDKELSCCITNSDMAKLSDKTIFEMLGTKQ